MRQTRGRRSPFARAATTNSRSPTSTISKRRTRATCASGSSASTSDGRSQERQPCQPEVGSSPSFTETTQIASVASGKTGIAIISAVAAVIVRSKSVPRQTAAATPRPMPNTATQTSARPIASGLGSLYLTHASLESPSGGPWRSGLPPIARISPNSRLTHTSSTGTPTTRLQCEDKHPLSCGES